MGQQESKQRLDQITQSLNRIRKDVRNGKITANDVERIQELLRKYSVDIEDSRNVRASSVYTVEQLIEITSKELDSLKQEINLDQASVPTNSFRRSSSKNMSKDKRKSIKSISASVQEIRQQIRSGRLQPADYDRVQSELANYSQDLSKKNKKHEADIAQKLISSVTQELFNKQHENSDTASLKRSSLKRTDRASLEEKRSSWVEKNSSKDVETQKEIPKIANKNTRSTLDDIDSKLENLQKDIKVAETNKEKSRLHFLSKSIQTLMTDLQMVNTNKEILQEQRKLLLEKNLQRAYQQIDKIKRQLTEENDLKYLTELHKKNTKDKHFQDLEEIQKGLWAISRNLSVENFQAERETFNMLKNNLNSIEDDDEEVNLKKSDVSGIVLDVENAFTRVEMEERLNQAEWRHFQYKIDLEQFKETSDSDIYKRHRQYLVQLRDYVHKVLEINNKVAEKKKYVMYNIDNNVVALDQKVKDNDNKMKNSEEVPTTKSKTSRDLVKDLLTSAKELQVNSEVLPVLVEVKSIIDQKLTVLQNQDKPDGNIKLVTIREKQLQSMENQTKPEDDDIHLVTVREKQLQPVTNPVLPVQTQVENIQKEVETLQIQIENSRYNKETQFYKDIKSKLEDYKSQVGQKSVDKSNDGLLNYIDNVLLLLDSNLPSRKSTTEDILMDIMSVSTRVNDLANKIENFGHTVQDCNSIKSSLIENRNHLRNLQIPSNRTNISKTRDDILQRIDHHLKTLDDMKKNENNTKSEDEKSFNQDLRKLKEKVARYSGTYRNVLYKTIENDLDKHLHKADAVFKDSSVALKVKQDIENTKMILEQKSTKDQQYANVKRKESGGKKLTEIRQNVDSVEETLNQNPVLTNDELEKLDARLTLSILALDNIRDDHSREEKERLYQDIHLYFQKIQELKLMTKPNSVHVDEYHYRQPDEKQLMVSTITRIERELEEIKPEILTFVGTENSPNFLLLDEILVRGTLKLDEMNLDQTSDLFLRKAKLMRDIHQFSDILDNRINQAEEVEKFEQQVKVMLIKIDSFNGFLGDAEYTHLDEEIIKLKISLGKLEVSPELAERKAACLREIDGCMKKLQEAARNRPDVLAGTLV